MIDLRSDTVTRPDTAMRQAMMNADVGDDVYGDDPSVNRLQAMAAELLGHEAALFMPTGTQSNLVALLTHCQRGDEYIVGADAHTYKYEGGGAAVLGGIQPQTVPFDAAGLLPLDDVASVIKEHDVHFARTRLLCLETTQHGRVQPLERFREARRFATDHALALHLDGARMANATTALNVSLADLAQCFDTVSICLSKGLGAPVGSLLVGSQGFIEEARRWRKVTGGGMRQAGILAAAGELALTTGYARLQEDHDNAAELAERLAPIGGFQVRHAWTQTNMIWLDYDRDHQQRLPAHAKRYGIAMSVGRNVGRLVLHRDIRHADLAAIVTMMRDYFSADESHLEASTS